MKSDTDIQSKALAVLRVVVGVVFLMHGGQKLFVLGIQGVAGFMEHLHIPLPMAAAVVLTAVEFLGGAALVVGLFTRWAASLIAFDMAMAILLVKWSGGFFNPSGFEYELTLLTASLVLALAGPGAASVDGALTKRE
jgi:putative oxidoreductase